MNDYILKDLRRYFDLILGYIIDLYHNDELAIIDGLKLLDAKLNCIPIGYKNEVDDYMGQVTSALADKFDNINRDKTYTIDDLINEVKIGTRNDTIDSILDGE